VRGGTQITGRPVKTRGRASRPFLATTTTRLPISGCSLPWNGYHSQRGSALLAIAVPGSVAVRARVATEATAPIRSGSHGALASD
jgi:hypothetical protein